MEEEFIETYFYFAKMKVYRGYHLFILLFSFLKYILTSLILIVQVPKKLAKK